MNTDTQPDLAAIAAQLDDVSRKLDRVLEREAKRSEFLDEMNPILAEVMHGTTENLRQLEERGYFAFGRELLRALDNIVSAYDADDARQLADNVVRIVDTIRNVTQPEVLALANEATDAVADAGDARPRGVFGVLRATQDDDVQKGMAVMLQVLRHVGRAASRTNRPATSSRERKLANALAPRLAPPAPDRPAARPATSVAPAPAAAAPTAGGISVAGFETTAEGFLVDFDTWTPAFAEGMAKELGFELTDDHRALIEFIRSDYQGSGTSPNVRRIGTIGPVDTKTLYRMFPTAPAIQAARIAGVPKPAGCI